MMLTPVLLLLLLQQLLSACAPASTVPVSGPHVRAEKGMESGRKENGTQSVVGATVIERGRECYLLAHTPSREKESVVVGLPTLGGFDFWAVFPAVSSKDSSSYQNVLNFGLFHSHRIAYTKKPQQIFVSKSSKVSPRRSTENGPKNATAQSKRNRPK